MGLTQRVLNDFDSSYISPDESIASIDSMIEEAMKRISHTVNACTQVLMDSNQVRSKRAELSKNMNELFRDTEYRQDAHINRVSKELLSSGIIRHINLRGLGNKDQTLLELIDKDELLLSLPYFALEKGAQIGMPIEDIIGNVGNKMNANGHINRMKYFISFYLNEAHPSISLNNSPKQMNRSQIHLLTGIHPTTIRGYDAKFMDQGLVDVSKKDTQMKYLVLRDFNEYESRHEGFKAKMKRLVDSGRFKVRSEVRFNDFKEALNDDSIKPSHIIYRLNNEGFIFPQRELQGEYSLTGKGREVAERIFIPIYKAIRTKNTSHITSSRDRHFYNPKRLLTEYLTRTS